MPKKCGKCGSVCADSALFLYGDQAMCFDCYAHAAAGDCTEAAQCMHKPPRTQLGEPCPAEAEIARLRAALVKIRDDRRYPDSPASAMLSQIAGDALNGGT
jgi:coenzyme F420-reducing hydrogenase beta subunit